ncbi:Flavin-dependent oxidoreductase, luciferase family (includes alkanesulfonate monooxygenase SsuD and methylene tetrahydromethanopterin reductase) [Pseudonocardia ammonioxydans]|uniref:Flavin-dependent oxidoreductase, luciferase family (Includes alkanesulfonate monooxygenase SsuD and methylene tetrahydromethanopterin reductase) n=1 Tax=Pseudonocardia ammonioxydans TaxID=260086 RepID=A0A1I5HUX1_PSUAM|nr:LLM class flavin-dependent oxidoreductase [Pseudonocardia ammonioxydans]SFO52105.1 Flavin-dependent oxidoreductase, luciferase family (includes alkanesulfonate monooxygenase SsuD and methylene tetrahydromethanopterin reductase) [Pseudonocardia ammonioxydans]
MAIAAELGLVPATPRAPHENTPLADGRTTNAMFAEQPLKLGLFGTNCSYGLTMSEAATGYELTWPHTLEIAQKADRIGFEALVPVARWRGFGSTTNYNGTCFETYTWAAGLSQATERITVFATSHVPTVHPIVAAKMATTIDHISGGRFGLNIVMGWFSPEMEMFDGTQREHDERYAYGQEWMDFVGRLWSEPGSFDVESTFFSCQDVEAYPKPVQGPRPVLINAGNSPAGMAFSARNVDVNFAAMTTVEDMADYTKRLRELARTDYDRDVSAMTYGLIVCRDTEAEAHAVYQDILDKGDRDGANNLMKVAGMQMRSLDAQIAAFQDRFIAGWGGYPIIGTPEQVVDELGRIHAAGMGGMIMGLLDYSAELDYFDDKIMPLLKEAGLRV